MPKLKTQGRVKPLNKWTNAEIRHRGQVKRKPCYGCGAEGANEAHHTMLHFPEKRSRRDNRFLMPLCVDCHRGRFGVHGIGSEVKWLERNGKTGGDAIRYMAELWETHNG